MGALIAIGIVAVYVVWRLTQSGGAPQIGGGQKAAKAPSRKDCKWEATGGGTKNLAEYQCQTCKVTAYSGGGKPPLECKRRLGGSL